MGNLLSSFQMPDRLVTSNVESNYQPLEFDSSRSQQESHYARGIPLNLKGTMFQEAKHTLLSVSTLFHN